MKIKISPLLLFLCLFLLVTCSPQKPEVYPLPNPILIAFNHQLDFVGLRDSIQKDSSLSITEIDGGLVLFSDETGGTYRFWMNDSLLVVHVNATFSLPLLGIGDQAIFESQRRQSNANIVVEMRELLTRDFRFSTIPTNTHYYSSEIDVASSKSSFIIKKEQLQAVDSLTWRSSAFAKQANYRFIDGYLHGQFTTLDSLGLFQEGYFQHGSEIGTWEYRDTLGKLQYTEEYALGGELQKVKHEKRAIYTREKPLPTLIYLWRIHWFMFVLLCLLGAYVFLKYFLSLRQFTRPYRGQAIGGVLLSIIVVSPILSFFAGLFALFSIMFISHGLGSLIGWDLPLHFLDILQWLLIFPIIECIWMWMCNRLQDTLWHTSLLILAILIFGEWHFLTQLEKYL